MSCEERKKATCLANLQTHSSPLYNLDPQRCMAHRTQGACVGLTSQLQLQLQLRVRLRLHYLQAWETGCKSRGACVQSTFDAFDLTLHRHPSPLPRPP